MQCAREHKKQNIHLFIHSIIYTSSIASQSFLVATFRLGVQRIKVKEEPVTEKFMLISSPCSCLSNPTRTVHSLKNIEKVIRSKVAVCYDRHKLRLIITALTTFLNLLDRRKLRTHSLVCDNGVKIKRTRNGKVEPLCVCHKTNL